QRPERTVAINLSELAALINDVAVADDGAHAAGLGALQNRVEQRCLRVEIGIADRAPIDQDDVGGSARFERPDRFGLGEAVSKPLPLWIETAIRLGTKFVRVAAAGLPPAASGFEPHVHDRLDDCVTCCTECGYVHPPLVDEYYFWLI